MAIEGLFFAVLSGVAPFVLIHYFIGKLIGPLLFGRLWCGWACWYGMIFDMLPYPFSYWRRDKRLSLLRYVHFFASGGLVALLWFGLGFQGTIGAAGVYWFLLGICIYYALGIVLALALKDHRAFCKYVCPVSVPMKAVGRLSLVKMDGTSACCPEGCQTCIEMCPMNIRVKDYLFAKTRILSTECILCMTCVNVCPQEALAPSIRLDFGGVEYWDHDPTRGNQNTVPNVAWIHDDEEAGRTDIGRAGAGVPRGTFGQK
jgi:ferredoxin-type protein NapH